MVLEGGLNTIRAVLEYVTDTPPVPVIVCAESGRAADLISFAYRNMMKDGYVFNFYNDQISNIKILFTCVSLTEEYQSLSPHEYVPSIYLQETF